MAEPIPSLGPVPSGVPDPQTIADCLDLLPLERVQCIQGLEGITNSSTCTSSGFAFPISNLPECAAGLYCPNIVADNPDTFPQLCPPTEECLVLRYGSMWCEPQGMYEPQVCSPGHYCPSASEMLPCPEGTWCVRGSSAPRTCQPLSYCPPGTQTGLYYGGALIAVLVDLLLIGAYVWVHYVLEPARARRLAVRRPAALLAAAGMAGGPSPGEMQVLAKQRGKGEGGGEGVPGGAMTLWSSAPPASASSSHNLLLRQGALGAGGSLPPTPMFEPASPQPIVGNPLRRAWPGGPSYDHPSATNASSVSVGASGPGGLELLPSPRQQQQHGDGGGNSTHAWGQQGPLCPPPHPTDPFSGPPPPPSLAADVRAALRSARAFLVRILGVGSGGLPDGLVRTKGGKLRTKSFFAGTPGALSGDYSDRYAAQGVGAGYARLGGGGSEGGAARSSANGGPDGAVEDGGDEEDGGGESELAQSALVMGRQMAAAAAAASAADREAPQQAATARNGGRQLVTLHRRARRVEALRGSGAFSSNGGRGVGPEGAGTPLSSLVASIVAATTALGNGAMGLDPPAERGASAEEPPTASALSAAATAVLAAGFRRCNSNLRLRLTFRGLSLVLPAPASKTILSDVSGVINPGRVTAILGPSGAGKTTFLSVLMGRLQRTSGDMRVSNKDAEAEAESGEGEGEQPPHIPGTPFFQGEPLSAQASALPPSPGAAPSPTPPSSEMGSFKAVTGYVPQHDVMLQELTVRENIEFSARVRLPRLGWSNTQIQRHVDAVIVVLGLTSCADTRVSRVSGGQCKRANVGIELAAAPAALFLDEPTSGLDATAALEVCRTLRAVADLGLTVVAVIHQPRTEIFQSFDDLLLLAPGGHTVYMGPRERVQPYFGGLGLLHSSLLPRHGSVTQLRRGGEEEGQGAPPTPLSKPQAPLGGSPLACDPGENPADFLLDLIAGRNPLSVPMGLFMDAAGAMTGTGADGAAAKLPPSPVAEEGGGRLGATAGAGSGGSGWDFSSSPDEGPGGAGIGPRPLSSSSTSSLIMGGLLGGGAVAAPVVRASSSDDFPLVESGRGDGGSRGSYSGGMHALADTGGSSSSAPSVPSGARGPLGAGSPSILGHLGAGARWGEGGGPLAGGPAPPTADTIDHPLQQQQQQQAPWLHGPPPALPASASAEHEGVPGHGVPAPHLYHLGSGAPAPSHPIFAASAVGTPYVTGSPAASQQHVALPPGVGAPSQPPHLPPPPASATANPLLAALAAASAPRTRISLLQVTGINSPSTRGSGFPSDRGSSSPLIQLEGADVARYLVGRWKMHMQRPVGGVGVASKARKTVGLPPSLLTGQGGAYQPFPAPPGTPDATGLQLDPCSSVPLSPLVLPQALGALPPPRASHAPLPLGAHAPLHLPPGVLGAAGEALDGPAAVPAWHRKEAGSGGGTGGGLFGRVMRGKGGTPSLPGSPLRTGTPAPQALALPPPSLVVGALTTGGGVPVPLLHVSVPPSPSLPPLPYSSAPGARVSGSSGTLGELQALMSNRGATFLRQFVLCHNRSLLQQYRMVNWLALELFVCVAAGVIMGLASTAADELFSGILRPPYTPISPSPLNAMLPSLGFYITMAAGLCGAPSAVKIFGEERDVFLRETGGGHDPTAYFLAKNVASLYRLTLAALHFGGFFALLARPTSHFSWLFVMIWGVFFGVYGMAMVVSMLVSRANAPLLAVIASLVLACLSGFAPSLSQGREWGIFVLQEASFTRWANELWLEIESAPYRGLFLVDEILSDGFGFTLGRPGIDIAAMVLLGVGYRLLALLGMLALGGVVSRWAGAVRQRVWGNGTGAGGVSLALMAPAAKRPAGSAGPALLGPAATGGGGGGKSV